MTEMDRFASDTDPFDEAPRQTPLDDPPELSRDEMKTLAALADGSLRSPDARADAQADPRLAAILAEQERAVAVVRGAADDVRAPSELRERLAELAPVGALAPKPARASRPASRVRRTRPRGLLAGIGALAVAVVVVLALSLSGAGGAPTVAQAAALATRPWALPAPRHAVDSSPLLSTSESGVPFPYWDDHFHVRQTAARTDTLGDRHATTVFYVDRHGRRIAYSIVSGPFLTPPKDARAIVRNGVAMWVATINGATVVTWARDGHTCVLVSRDVPARTLVALASWRAGGSIPY